METGETRFIEPKLRGSCPARWSPDGGSFLFCGSDENGRTGLFQVDVQTGERVRLKLIEDNGASFWTTWAPDGKTIYYRVDYGEESRIEALDLTTGAERTLRAAHPPNWIVMIWVDVSPDGEQLAFWEWSEDKSHLFVMPTSPGGARAEAREVLAVPLTPDERRGVGYVRWSRDGRYLMYQVKEGNSFRLWRVPAEGGEAEPLELILGEYPQFSPDGSRIAFDWGESAWEIWVMENYLPGR
jgi:Tol biopolymer transport system component